MSAKKWVYHFSEGNAKMKDLLGGKGANVSEMMAAGLPVPPGFTITTECCNEYYRVGKKFPEGMWEQALDNLKKVEATMGKKLGDPKNPLLVSVRSGAKLSMPGMMDTVLNLGLNDDTVKGLIASTGNERFAYDALRRFIQMFGKIVLEMDSSKFEHLLESYKEKKGVKLDTDLDAATLKDIANDFYALVKKEKGIDFPQDPMEQLRMAIEAVFASWNGPRAVYYRNFNKISHDLGTAVNVQTMVFGNMGNTSGTGVAFTRNPSTGENKLYGEYLLNAQGEDVVAGTRTPHPISEMAKELPEVAKQFNEIAQKLENHYRDVQDMEFTIENGKLYMLQTRTGKRTAQAAVKIAVDMVGEKLITKQEAISRVEPIHIDQLLHRRIDPKAKVEVIAKGLAASPGAASGEVVFDADECEKLSKTGRKLILVRIETNPDDVHGLITSQGVLTARGGMTSHAAVVARGIGKPCVAGCEMIKVDLEKKEFSVNGLTIKEGDIISINGSTGEVIKGAVSMIEPEMSGELKTLLGWADEFRTLQVWTNADYPRDAKQAREYGAQGIGLCRTEHMFMEQERLPIVQQMILAENDADRQIALDKLLPFQKSDFRGLFIEMNGLPVIIRLIDPPLHEFLPNFEDLLVEVTTLKIQKPGSSELKEKENLLKKVHSMKEQNPMLGLRGCRLGLTFPQINVMQTRAIIEAAVELTKEGIKVIPEIMVPLVGHVNELKAVKAQLVGVADEIIKNSGVKLEYQVGTMIEVPRAALTAGEIATEAEFFSFGTNDLTQTTFGYSRDDAEGKFLLQYVEKKILPENPFVSLDLDGVGKLIKMAVADGRATRPDMKVGICGEHGGDPASIAFCHKTGLNYVSCSPFRVPVARLAAAQAALGLTEKDK